MAHNTSNQALSQKRADTVMQFLITQGVKPDLLAAKGFGDADPVASNSPRGGGQRTGASNCRWSGLAVELAHRARRS